MRIAIATEFAAGLSFWERLADEGNEVAVWVKPKEGKDAGNGIVEKAGTWDALLHWAKTGALSGMGALVLFDSSGMGDLAEEARRWGLPVLGGGKFMDRLEKDRAFGFEVAQQAGAKIPPHERFDSFAAALAYARKLPSQVSLFFKSDRYIDADATHGAESRDDLIEYLEHLIWRHGSAGRCILQEKIEGIPISTARWWNGTQWVGPYEGTIEHKKFLNDDVGPSTGCSFNAVWFYETTPRIAELLGWENLAWVFRRNAAPPGLYDINAVATPDGQVYFLEWTPRFGYDSEPTSFRLYPHLTKAMYDIVMGLGGPEPSKELGYSVRLSVPPYPWEKSKKTDLHNCIGTFVSGPTSMWEDDFLGYSLKRTERGLEVAVSDGIVGLAYSQGDSLERAHKAALASAKRIRVPALQYRTDGGAVIAKDAKRLVAAGFALPSSLLQ